MTELKRVMKLTWYQGEWQGLTSSPVELKFYFPMGTSIAYVPGYHSPLIHLLVPHTVAKTLFPLEKTMEFHPFPDSGANQTYFSF